jgi:hypothetical protein
MRYRIPAATRPYTSRNHCRKYGRIPSLNKLGCDLSFPSRTICAMAGKVRLPQGFRLTFRMGS